MSKYYLTEAYGNLYNPRKADETFYENLRFVDYLMQEEIEEVMESLLWEFMDYGNTLDESYNLIESVFSDDVILEEALFEAVRMSPQRMAQRKAERQATLQQVSGEKAQARKEARKAAVTGALRSAGKAVQGAATGAGSAAMGAMRAGKQAAAGAYERAKGLPGRAMAALKGLVRKGATAAGRKIEKSGEEAQKKAQTSAAGASYGGSSVLARSKARTAGIEAASKTGSKRKTIGRLLRKAGAMVGRAGRGSGETKPMSRADLAANNARRADAARQAVGDPFSSTSSGRSTPSVTRTPASFAARERASAERKASTGMRQRAVDSATPASSERRYPTEKSGQTTLFTKPVAGKSAGADVKVPSGGQRKFGAARKSKGGSGKRQLPLNLKGAGYSETQRESVDFELLAQYILEDFINEGYADTYEDAFEILENLSEESILELTEMYLEG
jgi:hypothetical protein